MAAISALLDRDSCALRRLHRRLVSGNPNRARSHLMSSAACETVQRPGLCCDKWGRYMAMLEQSWSTENLQPGKALTYWRDVICENLLQMHIQSSQESAFFGQIEKHAFGPIKANFISVTEQRVWRDRTAACTAKDHLFHLIHVRKGVATDRAIRPQSQSRGGRLLADRLPCRLRVRFSSGGRSLGARDRKRLLSGWLPAPEDAAARLIDGP